jgi:hypothetical protein
MSARAVAVIRPAPNIISSLPAFLCILSGKRQLLARRASIAVRAISANYGVTVKDVALDAVPPGVVTTIFPVFAPVGTVAVIWLLLFTVNVPAFPPNVTLVAPVKPLPVIVTAVLTLRQQRSFVFHRKILLSPTSRCARGPGTTSHNFCARLAGSWQNDPACQWPLGPQSEPSPAVCPDGVLKNSKES